MGNCLLLYLVRYVLLLINVVEIVIFFSEIQGQWRDGEMKAILTADKADNQGHRF